MKVLAVGDMHFKEIYPYASSFEDRRLKERKEIEDAIIKASEDCDKIVLMGDVLDSRNNSSETIKSLTSFIERFGDKRVVIMGGNHDKFADGRCAMDYLREVSGKNWLLATRGITTDEDGDVYVPYLRKQELGEETDQGVVMVVESELSMDTLDRAIFLHHCLSGTKTVSGQLTDLFHEPVFPSKRLSERFKQVFGAHIHKPQDDGNIHVLGSVMNFDVGEYEPKRVIKWDTETNTIESIPLPGRGFRKIVNPTMEQVDKLVASGYKMDGLLRVVADKIDPVMIEKLQTVVSGEILTLELPKADRKRIKEDVNDFSINNLLKIYSEVSGVDVEKLNKGMALIQE